MFDQMADKIAGAVTGAFQSRLDAMMSSWVGLLIALAAVGMIIFPMVRAAWKLSSRAIAP
jgi:hypothetical protein